MEYGYILSNLFLIISALLVKKKDEKMNFFSSIIVTIIIYLCYNSVVAYLLNVVGIKINLVSMSTINILVSIIVWGVQILKLRRVKIQKYYINLKELLLYQYLPSFLIFLFMQSAFSKISKYAEFPL